MQILFLGDMFGQPGRDAVISRLPDLVDEQAIDFVIANGENAANGAGITSKIAGRLLAAGIDVLTTGNHVWRQREVYPFLVVERPHRAAGQLPGRRRRARASPCARRATATQVAVHQPPGRACSWTPACRRSASSTASSTKPSRSPRRSSSTSTPRRPARKSPWRGTSTAASRPWSGTHTHVQTADERVSPHGTAAITDVGMCGPHDSVIGVRADIILRRFLTELPAQFEVADGDVRLNGVVITAEAGARRRSSASSERA